MSEACQQSSMVLLHCRYYKQGTKKLFSVKKISEQTRADFGHLFDNEVAPLQAANACCVDRVATFVEQAFCLNGDDCLVLRWTNQ